jgi:hypothetical protein
MYGKEQYKGLSKELLNQLVGGCDHQTALDSGA